MAGWHHWLDGRESEWTPGVGNGQGGLACCDSWGQESDMTELLNWTEECSTTIESVALFSLLTFAKFLAIIITFNNAFPLSFSPIFGTQST